MLSTPTYIISHFLNWPQIGSGFLLPAHWEGGAGARIDFVAAKNPVRPSEGMAEGGCGGNSALPSQKTEASSATLLFKARHHRKILFSLGEKEIRRAQNEKSKEYFSVVWRAKRAVAELASLVPFKVGSSKVQNIPPNETNRR
ncbi:MAG: hypothetical protein Q7K44_02655 [Candidatus Liptonbacteria bacterium]|nr:hypothetical protein [Candidatus Liptonbacteria bacterium]